MKSNLNLLFILFFFISSWFHFLTFTLCLIYMLGCSIWWNHILLIWRIFPAAVCYKKPFLILNCKIDLRFDCDSYCLWWVFQTHLPQNLITAEKYWCQRAGMSNTWRHTRGQMNIDRHCPMSLSVIYMLDNRAIRVVCSQWWQSKMGKESPQCVSVESKLERSSFIYCLLFFGKHINPFPPKISTIDAELLEVTCRICRSVSPA